MEIKCDPRILYSAKVPFKYKDTGKLSTSCQNSVDIALLSTPEESIRKWASDNKNEHGISLYA